MMKVRKAKKILKIWDDGTDKRFFNDEGIIEENITYFAHLYRKAVVKDNKLNHPGVNNSIWYNIYRNSKSCGNCSHFINEDAYGCGWCSKCNKYTECDMWCNAKFFAKKKEVA